MLHSSEQKKVWTILINFNFVLMAKLELQTIKNGNVYHMDCTLCCQAYGYVLSETFIAYYKMLRKNHTFMFPYGFQKVKGNPISFNTICHLYLYCQHIQCSLNILWKKGVEIWLTIKLVGRCMSLSSTQRQCHISNT